MSEIDDTKYYKQIASKVIKIRKLQNDIYEINKTLLSEIANKLNMKYELGFTQLTCTHITSYDEKYGKKQKEIAFVDIDGTTAAIYAYSDILFELVDVDQKTIAGVSDKKIIDEFFEEIIENVYWEHCEE